ncbi:MAG: N-acetyltransferase family protein [Bacteroides sp.]|nr:N-acetyltransferase family protein [Bacteroides sp.]
MEYSETSPYTLRRVVPEDIPAICRIYNHYIEHTAVTFEMEPLSPQQIRERMEECEKQNYPFFVVGKGSLVVGYAYIHQWDRRQAYRSTCEITIYLDKDYTGRGYGRLLYEMLIGEIDKTQVHVLIAGICLPNQASVRLHEKFGFKQVSHMREIGWKLGEWRDVGHWQLIF